MLEIERNRLTWSRRPAAEINDALRGFAEFYALYLGEKKTPGEVLKLRPHLAPLWYDAPDGQYGRPAAFYHQVAALNPERAWASLDVPVLVLYGEYDWIMSPAEHHRIAEVVNTTQPGRATLRQLPRTSHGLKTYARAQDAFDGRDGQHDDTAVQHIVEWLRTAVPAGATVGGH
jgi:pimeloyl-ACP methyl ester carboxylesterase